MKLLVLSDSHRHIDRMRYATEQTNPDVILHLGDNISDVQELRRQFPDITFYMVKGNGDFQAHGETELLITLDGVKIYMTHGHIYRVKNGLYSFTEASRIKGADLALYGKPQHLANFIPMVISMVNVHDNDEIIPSVKLRLTFMEEYRDADDSEYVLPLKGLEIIANWRLPNG